MPLPFIIPFLFGVGVGATGTLAYMSTDPKPAVKKKKDNVIHLETNKKKPTK